jgi:hypothetical protein
MQLRVSNNGQTWWNNGKKGPQGYPEFKVEESDVGGSEIAKRIEERLNRLVKKFPFPGKITALDEEGAIIKLCSGIDPQEPAKRDLHFRLVRKG